MNSCRVTFRPEGASIEVPSGISILKAAHLAGISIVSPCNGQGTCGRCRVLLADRGSVLACQEIVRESIIVDVPMTARPDGQSIQLDSTCDPSAKNAPKTDPLLLGAAPPLADGRLRTPSGILGLAVDVGTSTIAAELIDLSQGRVLARAGKANAQAAYGAEVTRRIEHTEDHGIEPLARAAVEDLTALIAETTDSANTGPDQIRTIAVAGNTAMMHFLHRIDPSPIRRTPHTPSAVTPKPIHSSSLGIAAHSDAMIATLPWIGGWVGGDITAGILATGIHRDERLTLFLDIGTNGEIVLGNRDWLVACAASAGPAFEGCGLRDGMSARNGAIDRVRVAPDGAISVETIGGMAPLGLCGTGLISAIAGLFRAHMLDRAGRIHTSRAIEIQGEQGILVVPPEKTGHGRPIALLQRDIDAVIRAKAALFAGVRSLVASLDLTVAAIDRWILSGGFGSRLDPADAITLGLIAEVDPEIVEFAGNTSLRGARQVLLHRSAWEEAQTIADATAYLELIDQPGYFEEFTSAKFIPHTDLGLFPRALQARGEKTPTEPGRIEGSRS